jgi:ParB-like chromosome segregation protein Spo0J
MKEAPEELCRVELGELGERLSALRLRESARVDALRRSLEQHGQLSSLTVFSLEGRLEIIDGFKRVHAARALGLATLVARVDKVSLVDAKLRVSALSERSGMTELEEGWLVRSLYREDRLGLPEIARLMGRHRSWVWRRLMVVEALDVTVQADVRLGLVVPRAAVAVCRLPRGNQTAASAVVIRRGLTVRQTELLVEQALAEPDASARAALLTRRLDENTSTNLPGRRPTRAIRNEADWMVADAMKAHELCARLSARLLATPVETFTPGAFELLREALERLVPVLRALEEVIARATKQQEVA